MGWESVALRPLAVADPLPFATWIEAFAGAMHAVAGKTILVQCDDLEFTRVAVCGEVLERILLNLIRNAAQATSPGGTIAVSARRQPYSNFVMVAVEDAGPGMAASELAHLGRSARPRERKGVGLVVVRLLVAGSGGAIRIVSRERVGTRVEIFFPVVGIVAAGDAVVPFRNHEFLSGTPDPLAGGAMRWLHRGPASKDQNGNMVESWDRVASRLDNGRGSDGKGAAYVI